MADKQLLLKRNAEDGFFADDDPLAELARIASFDLQGEVRPKPSNQRREPEFNLEDELLKEFEQYEEPAVSAPSVDLSPEPEELPAAEEPATAVAAPVLADQPVLVDEAAFSDEPALADEQAFADRVVEAIPAAEAAPVAATEPVIEPALLVEPELLAREFPELRAVPEPRFKAPAEPVRPVSHPVFDLEDEILREFAAFDAKRGAPHAGQPAAEGQAIEPVVASQPVQAVEIVPVAAEVHQPAEPYAEPVLRDLAGDEAVEARDAHLGYGDDELSADFEALPESVSLDAPALDAMEAEVDPVRWQETKQSIVEQEQAYGTPQVDEAPGEPARFVAEPADEERWDDELSVELPADFQEEFVTPVAELHSESVAAADAENAIEQAPEPIVAPSIAEPVEATVAAAPRGDDFGLDALLADVERFPVNATPARWPAPVIEPKAKEPVEIVAAAPVAEAAKAEVEVAKPAAVQTAAPAVEPVQAAEPPQAKDTFDDGSFELDLTEIELDMLEMEVESSVAPALHQDPIVASPAALADVAKVNVEERPAYVPERSFTPAPTPVEDYSSLPFDPSQVTSEEDPVEALAEMNVPDAPVVEHEVPVPPQPDYDIDINAEMAHIFSRPTEPAMRQTGSQAKSGQPAAPVATVTSADLDEFERALEEDFRRSLSENRASSTPDRVALTPATYDTDRRHGSTGRRLTILAASVAGLVLIGGAGVYAFWGTPGEILSTSSEPKIILADKDPVKVLPKDPGGRTVPNQDKAVYERVSGDDKNITKQERLVTSNEEPVDVVQKTLMPETLPMDDEDQATNATDINDTTDPRLLPDGHDKNITTTEKVVSGVSPRKVRTMVVRSDGTLVPRDDEADAAADAKQATPAEASQERSLDITPAATENVPERLSANDAVAKEIQAASADTKSFVPEAGKLAETADAAPVTDDSQAVTQDQPAADDNSDALPVEAKPADAVPVKKEDIAAIPATQTDDASDTTAAADNVAKPAEQTAIKDAAAADVEETAPIREVKTTKISANTPIPENRPVDQPVDIVGRVTDQGNVQKTQEMANADPVQPADNAQTTTPAGGYVIQIASLPSAAEAQTSYNKLSAKFANVIGGHGVDIRKAAIKNKGTYYRVRIPAGSRQEANDLCSRYKAAGGSCLVSK